MSDFDYNDWSEIQNLQRRENMSEQKVIVFISTTTSAVSAQPAIS